MLAEGFPGMIETFLLRHGSHTKVTGPKSRDATITFEVSREILWPKSGPQDDSLFVAFYS